MPKKRISEEQIALALRQEDAGRPVKEICRHLGMSSSTFYRWKKVYVGMGLPEIRLLRQLEDENKRLKRQLADLTVDQLLQQHALSKKR